MTHTILAIDDEEICLEVIELFLQANGYEVVPALGGDKGIDMLKSGQKKIDVIMLDLMMPGIGGLDVLKKIKSDPNLSQIPVILQTGSSNDIELEKASDIGIAGYVRKPYDCEDLLNAVASAMKTTELQKIYQ
ncbi:MAG: response regulator [Alphaproteobacteria bacterium]